MSKQKLSIQIVICLMITAGAWFGGQSDHPVIAKWYTTASRLVMTEVTREDMASAWAYVSDMAKGAPSKVVSAVVAVNEETKYGTPIDEKTTTRYKQVHAVAGGMVLKSGKNDVLGLYVQIQHEDAVSTYGHLRTVGVVEKERVQRGEIIGSYDSLGEEEFYYDLQANL